MKNKVQKIFKQILCVILSLAMLSVLAVNAFAESAEAQPIYLKDVQLIYAESKSEAEAQVPKGYKLLKDDLNKGADTDYQVYFAYTTTTDPSEAITDIKMMNMNGGFVLSDYEEQIKNVQDNVKKMANDIKISVEMFAENYQKGTYGALAAYRALSAFTVDEADNQNLADYLLYGNPDDAFYVKLLLNAHQNIISSILSALAMAVQGEPGDTWLDRLAKIEDPNDCGDSSYWDDAEILWEHFCGFYDVYKTIDHARYDDGNGGIFIPQEEDKPPVDINPTPEQPDIANNGAEVLYEIAYRVLKQYSFGTGTTVSEWLLDEIVFEDMIFESFYCLVEVMTPEELAVMRLCGPLYMILATGMDSGVYKDYLDSMNEITDGKSVCSIWTGVNVELFRSSIGITDEAVRRIAETEFEQGLNNEGDDGMDAALKTAGLVAACGLVSLGVGVVVGKIAGVFISASINNAILLSLTAASAKAVVGLIFGTLAAAAGVVALVVALVVAIVFLVNWLIEYHKETHPTYTEIPEFMYDFVSDGSGNSQFILYEGVRFQDGKVADVNVWKGREWHAMYVSRDRAAGAPIEADFVVRYGDGHIDKDYAGLANFGYANAENLNHYDFDDDVNGVYVTYRQKDLTGDYARGDYLTGVQLFSNEDAEKCKLELQNQRYVIYEQNLTPNSDYVTYLGYKTSNNASRALTDIRVAYDYSETEYAAGGGTFTYAASGSAGEGKLTLYTTSIGLFGSPIRSDFLILNDRNAPAGYEPVNLFSGGPAINFNLEDDGPDIATEKPFYFYFLPSTTYTSGPEYLGGISFIYEKAVKFQEDNGLGGVERASQKLGYKVLYTTTSKDNLEGSLVYTTTHNPYRAIYGITALQGSETLGRVFSETIFYDGVGYSLTKRFVVTSDEGLAHEYHVDATNDARLYTAGVYNGGTPILASDLYVSTDRSTIPEGFAPVSARLSGDNRPVNLARGFYQSLQSSRPGGQPTVYSFDPFYLFVRGKGYKEGNYLTNLYVVSKEQVLQDAEIDCDLLDNAYVMNTLAAQGAHTVIEKNLNLEDSDNATYLAYTKMHRDNMPAGNIVLPITNLILYYAGETNAEPTETIVQDGITYHLVSSANIFCEENAVTDTCERVYLYYTTNPAAGNSIIDIQIDNTAILNGWETVRTQNNKALYDDMDAYSGNMWFIHMKRTTEDPKYISEVVVGVGGNDAEAKAVLIAAGCDYMLEKDFNNGVGAHSDYIYIGYKRTSNPNEAIRDLRTTHDNEVDSFVKNGATYYKIDGNLNSYTNVFADDIFLYYTRDAKAGTPITSLGTSKTVANWTHGEGNRYVVKTVLNQHGEASDLNDGALGDCIYLLITRDKQDEKGAIASMIGNGSLIIVIAFVVISIGAIAWVCIAQKKRRIEATVGIEVLADDATGKKNKSI